MKKKNGEKLQDLWYIISKTSLQIIDVPNGEKRDMGGESIFKERMAENFPSQEFACLNS